MTEDEMSVIAMGIPERPPLPDGTANVIGIVERLRGVRRCVQFDSAGRMVAFDGEPSDLERLAADEIERLHDLVRTLIENDPQEPISDAGHVLLDLWRHDARKALGLPEQQATPAFKT